MFTVLSNTRNSGLYLIAALAVMIIVLLTFVIAPAISASRPASAPAMIVSESGSDYYQRHPELRVSAAPVSSLRSDFFQRHPDWISSVQIAAVPVTGVSGASDYFQRHSELRVSAASAADVAGDFSLRRHPAWMANAQPAAIPVTGSAEASDYFQRHPELNDRPGLACESPVDCR